MIPSPNAYFTAQEARKRGAEPVFTFVITPHYFLNGVAAGSGTFTDMTFVSPDRLQVDSDAATASWVSPALQATVEDYPTTVEITFTVNYPGYTVVVEYRTATSSAGLSAASYAAVDSGDEISLYEFYQWKVTWTAYRSQAVDVVGDANSLTAYAIDSEPDDYVSYASDSVDGDNAAYIEDVNLAGEFTLARDDVLDNGEVSLDCSSSFGELVAGEHTLVLTNKDHKYSQHHDNFIFAGETQDYQKDLIVRMGYRRPGTSIIDSFTLYRGTIMKWGPVSLAVDKKGKLQPLIATVYTRDIISYLLKRRIGRPASNGDPQPLIYGTYLAEAEELADQALNDPVLSADFEEGTPDDLTSTTTAGSGTVTISADDPYEGDYQCRFNVETDSDKAWGELSSVAAFQGLLATVWLKFSAMPAEPGDKNLVFMRLLFAGGATADFYVDNDFRVWMYFGGGYFETEWYLNQNDDTWVRVSLGLYAASDGILKMWVNGDEVLTYDGDWSGYPGVGLRVGLDKTIRPLGTSGGWQLDTDNWELTSGWEPQVYKIFGGPFTQIGTVYQDAAVMVAKPVSRSFTTPYTATSWWGYRPGPGNWTTYNFTGAVPSSAATFTKDLVNGAIIFAYPQEVGGTVLARVTANDLTHPVDIIEALLTEAGVESYIDSTSFAAAKAALPDDSLACRFEDVSVTDAIKEICDKCLLHCVVDAGEVKLLPYSGAAPTSADLVVDKSMLSSIETTVDHSEMWDRVAVRWGWHDRNKRLRYEADYPEAPAELRDIEQEIDLTWGQMVATENAGMAKEKADRLLTRHKLQQEVVEASGVLSLARLELGDVVELDSAFYGDPWYYRVYGKRLSMSPPYGVDLVLMRHLGEA